jgi:hypothetical protein
MNNLKPFPYFDCYLELRKESGYWEKQKINHQNVSFVRGIIHGLVIARTILMRFHKKRLEQYAITSKQSNQRRT